MELIKTLISWTHIFSAFLSIILGGIVLLSIKGNLQHKRMGIYYFYLMLANNITALFIYNAFGKWFFPHSLAVATLIIILPAYLIIKFKRMVGYWLKIHITCFVISYYLLIGGAINEAFLRIKPLMKYPMGSPIHGMTHFLAMLLFIGLLIFFLIKYRRKQFTTPK